MPAAPGWALAPVPVTTRPPRLYSEAGPAARRDALHQGRWPAAGAGAVAAVLPGDPAAAAGGSLPEDGRQRLDAGKNGVCRSRRGPTGRAEAWWQPRERGGSVTPLSPRPKPIRFAVLLGLPHIPGHRIRLPPAAGSGCRSRGLHRQNPRIRLTATTDPIRPLAPSEPPPQPGTPHPSQTLPGGPRAEGTLLGTVPPAPRLALPAPGAFGAHRAASAFTSQ